ncbi:hypothetical protein N9R09_02925 [Porticoccaceae bacterium]|nr:hypothetical protein [Porticoccaceae bacterium]
MKINLIDTGRRLNIVELVHGIGSVDAVDVRVDDTPPPLLVAY